MGGLRPTIEPPTDKGRRFSMFKAVKCVSLRLACVIRAASLDIIEAYCNQEQRPALPGALKLLINDLKSAGTNTHPYPVAAQSVF